jgi:hypothetical protein
MKYFPFREIVSAFLMLACCLISSNAEARTPRTREVKGVIQSVDYGHQTMTLNYAQGLGPKELVWRPETEFQCGTNSVPAMELKAGMSVTVDYHSPFFGKPYATRVVLPAK